LVKASALQPDNKEIMWKLIPFYISKQRYNAASAYLDKLAEQYKSDPKFWTYKTEILENLAKMPNVYAEWAPNEKVALDVAIGAAYAGTECRRHCLYRGWRNQYRRFP
jgi:predicted Zn-dependent protease